MIQVELPNMEDTQDPVVRKLIKAVQELADQSSSFDTGIFNEMNQGIKTLNGRMSNNEKSLSKLNETVDQGSKELRTNFSSLEETMNHGFQESSNQFDALNGKFDQAIDLLKQIAENTKRGERDKLEIAE